MKKMYYIAIVALLIASLSLFLTACGDGDTNAAQSGSAWLNEHHIFWLRMNRWKPLRDAVENRRQ